MQPSSVLYFFPVPGIVEAKLVSIRNSARRRYSLFNLYASRGKYLVSRLTYVSDSGFRVSHNRFDISWTVLNPVTKVFREVVHPIIG